MTNFTHKIALIEFQIQAASKITHLQDLYYQISESGKPANNSRISFVMFIHQNIFFFMSVFFHKSQSSLVGLFNF